MLFKKPISQANVPIEILVEIVNYIPVQDIPRWKLASQIFYNLFEQEYAVQIIDKNYQKSIVPYQQKLEKHNKKISAKIEWYHRLCFCLNIGISIPISMMISSVSLYDWGAEKDCLEHIRRYNDSTTCNNLCTTGYSFNQTQQIQHCAEIMIPVDLAFVCASSAVGSIGVGLSLLYSGYLLIKKGYIDHAIAEMGKLRNYVRNLLDNTVDDDVSNASTVTFENLGDEYDDGMVINFDYDRAEYIEIDGENSTEEDDDFVQEPLRRNKKCIIL